MTLHNLTARIDGDKILLKYADAPEPLQGDPKYRTTWTGIFMSDIYKEDRNKWLSSHKEVELKPEFRKEFEELTSFNDIHPLALKTGISIESIKHRIGITRDCGENGCAPFGACSNPCKMVAILLPEVKEETQDELWSEVLKMIEKGKDTFPDKFTITRNK